MVKYLTLLTLFLFAIGSQAMSKKPVTPNNSTVAQTSEKTENTASTKVYKADDSLQCHPDSGISAEEMANTLGDITIIKSSKKHDGRMRATLCGTPTGYINIYEIKTSDLDKALSKGFKEYSKIKR